MLVLIFKGRPASAKHLEIAIKVANEKNYKAKEKLGILEREEQAKDDG